MGKGLFEGWHIVILLLVIVVLFGWKRLPDAARGLGRSMRIFKSEVEEMKKDGKAPPSAASSDTVRGETVRPTPAPEPTLDPPASQASAPTEREMHNRPPV
ncbi:MAG: Sec-independent protein translocase subunit TatA [Dermatophilaceae bacterium]